MWSLVIQAMVIYHYPFEQNVEKKMFGLILEIVNMMLMPINIVCPAVG